MSRITFVECPSLDFVLFNRQSIGFININGFFFYRKTKRKGFTWDTFTPEEKEQIREREITRKND